VTVVEDEMIQLIWEEIKNQREKEQQGKRPKIIKDEGGEGRGEEDGGHSTSSSSSTHKKAVRS
jgi:hypothetical protein